MTFLQNRQPSGRQGFICRPQRGRSRAGRGFTEAASHFIVDFKANVLLQLEQFISQRRVAGGAQLRFRPVKVGSVFGNNEEGIKVQRHLQNSFF